MSDGFGPGTPGTATGAWTDRWPATPALGADEVHVWEVDLDGAAAGEQLAGLLSADEHDRADRFVFPEDRQRFVVRRGVLRALLAGYLDRRPDTVELGYAAKGKPELAGPDRSGVTFNCSHANGLAVYAFAHGRRVGIDVEAVRALPEAAQIAELCFSARERSELATFPPGCRDEAVIRGFTRKEAYAKAVGDGLTRPLEGVEASLAASASPALHAIDGDAGVAARWSLHAWSPAGGYVAALVVERADRSPVGRPS